MVAFCSRRLPTIDLVMSGPGDPELEVAALTSTVSADAGQSVLPKREETVSAEPEQPSPAEVPLPVSGGSDAPVSSEPPCEASTASSEQPPTNPRDLAEPRPPLEVVAFTTGDGRQWSEQRFAYSG